MSASSPSVTRVIIHGAAGRVGARLCELAHHDAALVLVAAIDAPSHARSGAPSATASPRGDAPKIAHDTGELADVVIDFTSDDGARQAADLAARARAALLVGSTGLSERTLALLRGESARRAVLVAPNTSLGVAVAAELASRAAALLGKDFSVSIVEAHHAAKKDAPSGTALRLADAVRRGGGLVNTDQVLAVRGGDVVGEHTIRFAGSGEYLEVTHRATSRDLFVRGALRAAQWLHARPPGWWTMEHVLGLASSV